jgi:transposase
MRRKVNQLPDEVKYKVVQEYLQTSIRKKDLMHKYGIRGENCILNWMRKFGLSYPTKDQLNLNNQVTKESGKTPREQELEQRLKTLEKDLAYEKLRTRALNTLIDIAEEELKVSIRKKSGAKQ